MIVYAVERRYFPMKAEADAFRRARKLVHHAIRRLDVRTREELAALLNEVAAPQLVEHDGPTIAGAARYDADERQQLKEQAQSMALTREAIVADLDGDDIPAFLKAGR